MRGPLYRTRERASYEAPLPRAGEGWGEGVPVPAKFLFLMSWEITTRVGCQGLAGAERSEQRIGPPARRLGLISTRIILLPR